MPQRWLLVPIILTCSFPNYIYLFLIYHIIFDGDLWPLDELTIMMIREQALQVFRWSGRDCDRFRKLQSALLDRLRHVLRVSVLGSLSDCYICNIPCSFTKMTFCQSSLLLYPSTSYLFAFWHYKKTNKQANAIIKSYTLFSRIYYYAWKITDYGGQRVPLFCPH